MNPQHLMPGNYILYNGKEVIVTPQLLITMQSPCKCKLFSPIELTEQWLIDFKIKKLNQRIDNSHVYEFENDETYFSICRINNSFIIFIVSICGEQNNEVDIASVRYVHQFQNIYMSLTQKQLTK